MLVWLFKLGENIPVDGNNPKLSRTAMLAEEFSTNGHNVVWWMSTYDHLTKRQRSDEDQTIDIRLNYQIRMLHTPGYSKNVSLQRLRDHQIFDQRLKQEIQISQSPDVIIASYPTIGACQILINFAMEKKLPIFIDARDMWPDIFREYLPYLMHWFYPLIFKRQISSAVSIFNNATGIIGITDEFVEWALSYTERSRDFFDHTAPLGYNKSYISTKKSKESYDFWGKYDLTNKDQIVCFFGVMSKKIDLDIVASALPALSKKFPRFKLVLCGNGDEDEKIKQIFSKFKNVIFPGWVNKSQIKALMQISTLGLAPYVSNRPDFLISMPTKIIEYLSESLPVLTSLKGVSKKILLDNNCGRFFDDEPSFIRSVSDLLNSKDELRKARTAANHLFECNYRGDEIYKGVRLHIEKSCLIHGDKL